MQTVNITMTCGNIFMVSAEHDNEFLIGWRDAGIIAVRVQSHVTNVPLNAGYNVEDLWTNWHKHCFTWKASGSFKVRVFTKMFCFRSE